MYGYTCDSCNAEFDLFIGIRQASCNCAIPNMKYATCIKCGNLAKRDYKDTHLSSLMDNTMARAAALIGSPRPDPAFDGKLSVNAGRATEVFLAPSSVEPDDINKVVSLSTEVVITPDPTKCSCDYCTPSNIIERTSGKELQLNLDKQMGEFLQIGMADLDGIHVDNRRLKREAARSAEVQELLNSDAMQLQSKDIPKYKLSNPNIIEDILNGQ